VIRAGLVLAVALSVGMPSSVLAQAWVPPAGIGIVSVVYQSIDNTNHRLADGSLLDGFDSMSRGVLINLDYAITDRLSFSVGFPYIAAKYTGPEPSLFLAPIDECHCWNHGWQDVSGTVRYNIRNDAFGLTPSVSFGVPSHGYDSIGEAVLGRNLRELRIGIDAGHRLDAISDTLSISTRYSYAVVEQVADLPNNRSNIAFEVGVLPTRRISTRAILSWQRSHGGLRSTEITEETFLLFDRLLKDNNFHIGGGIAYSLPRFDVFASFTHYASGTDTHAGRALTFGVSVPFER
jgi:hypothetical protein